MVLLGTGGWSQSQAKPVQCYTLYRLFILRHHGNTLHYRVATPSSDPVEDRRTLEHYFRLDSDLTSLYSQ